MTVIAYEIAWCDTFECDGPATEDPDEPGTCNECGQTLERIKVVRADAYQGAVADLARITELAQAAVRDCREPDKVLAYTHEIAILAAGGQ